MENILIRHSDTFTNLHINRPSNLNSLSNDMVHSLRQGLNTDQRIIFTGEGRSFCAGGDILSLVTGSTKPSDFFRNEFRLFYEISCLKQETVAVLDGITMGGGVGLSMACKYRVLTGKTLWAMPETAIGFFPDVGASFFLNKLTNEPLGLYLGLTGARLNGVDSYFAGVSEYYAETLDDRKKGLIFTKGLEGITSFCHSPDSLKSELLKDLPLITHCFDSNFTVEEIIARLMTANNDWSRKTVGILNEMSPLSLKITREMNNRGKILSYFDSLELEYDLCVKVTEVENANFVNSITHKLINKSKTPVQWLPGSLAEISDSRISSLFSTFNNRLYTPAL